jgi:prepilin-type N-terminal cleavage/methylation domain-containing protein
MFAAAKPPADLSADRTTGNGRAAIHAGASRPQELLSSVLRPLSSDPGFTLIELLVVCAVLAALAYIAWGGYAEVEPRARDELARTQALTLAKALARFRQDTGYWPGEGPFQYSEDCDPDNAKAMNPDKYASQAWLKSPANLTLLFEKPELCAEPPHPLAALGEWDPDGRRGWNGPYLPLAARHWLDMGADPKNPETAPILKDIPAFAAGPDFAAGSNFRWRGLPSDSGGYERERHDFGEHPRPLLFLRDADKPRVVYWGVDGRYGGTNADNPCLPNATDAAGKDDIVICL